MALVVFLLARLFPPTGDDWSRIAFGPRTLGSLLDKAWQTYTDHNGRLLGNSLSFALIEPVWLRAAAKAAAIVGLVAVTVWLARGRSLGVAFLAFAGLLLLPPPLFRESYGWSAGFFNYVPPMLAVLFLAGLLGAGGRAGGAGRRAVTVLLAGIVTFAGCLFVEHVTAALLTLAVGGFAGQVLRRRPDAAAGAAALGAILGTVVMLASPGLRTVGTNQDDYFSYAASLADLVATAVPNFAIVAESFVLSNPVLLALLAGTVLAAAVRGRPGASRDGTDVLLAVATLVVVGYAAASRLAGGGRLTCAGGELAGCDRAALALELSALLILLAVLAGATVRYVAAGAQRHTATALLVATIAMLGPLLLVAPIGPRNVYCPTVTVLAFTALLARPMLEDRDRRFGRLATAALGVACVTGSVAVFAIQRANAQVAHERVAIMAAAVRAGADEARLPPFPHPEWVHHPNDKKIGVRYYRDEPRDIDVVAR